MKFSLATTTLSCFLIGSCIAGADPSIDRGREAELLKTVDQLTAENAALRKQLTGQKAGSATNLLVVHVTERLGFLVGDKLLTEEELNERLKSLFTKDKDHFILIQTHKFGPYQSVIVVMEACEKIGLKNVFYQVPKE